MKEIAFKLSVIVIACFIICQTAYSDESSNTLKGANEQMRIHYIGRFSLAVPIEMKIAGIKQTLRYVEFKEAVWPNGNNIEDARSEAWTNLLNETNKLRLPDGQNKIIIKAKDFSNVGQWAKGIFYYDRDISSRSASWKVLIDTGNVGFWLKGEPVVIERENKSHKMEDNISSIGKSYHAFASNVQRPKGDWFHLQHGAINLPYDEQEESYVRFEGHPLKLKIEIEMHETYKVKKAGLIEKTVAAIMSGYASGVELKKIRSHKRVVAGLDGEEEVIRGTENKESKLNFAWEYVGKENSGEHPRTLITMDSDDGNLEEKLKIWDAILDSMQPMYK